MKMIWFIILNFAWMNRNVEHKSHKNLQCCDNVQIAASAPFPIKGRCKEAKLSTFLSEFIWHTPLVILFDKFGLQSYVWYKTIAEPWITLHWIRLHYIAEPWKTVWDLLTLRISLEYLGNPEKTYGSLEITRLGRSIAHGNQKTWK